MKPVLYQGMQPGGQLTTTNEVENFPGYPDGINGPEMMMQLQQQAERFETDIRYGMVTKVDFSALVTKKCRTTKRNYKMSKMNRMIRLAKLKSNTNTSLRCTETGSKTLFPPWNQVRGLGRL